MIRVCMGNSQMEVRAYRPEDEAKWAEFVVAEPSATLFHRPQWLRAVEEAYGHRPYHLTAWRDGSLAGILPLFLVKSPFLGRALVSIPYATYGGVAAVDDEAAQALLEAARKQFIELRATQMELRHRHKVHAEDMHAVPRYVTFRKPLPDRPEQVLAGLPKRTRAAARNGLKALGAESVAFGPQWLDKIYSLYAYSLRRLGSPNYRRRLFHALRREYGEDCLCAVVRDSRGPVAGVVSFVFRDEIVPYFIGSLPRAAENKAVNVLLLRLMEHAVERGLRVVDFNRTRRDNPGPADFKRHQGAQAEDLHYQVLLQAGRSMPNLTPSNPKFALAGRMWRRLPLWLTRAAGQWITRWIP